MQKEVITIVWFRNDLRLHDNQVIESAVNAGLPIIAIYSLEPRFFKPSVLNYPKLGHHRFHFLLQALSELQSSLAEFNIPLLVANLSPDKCLERLSAEFKIQNLFYQNDWTTEEFRVEQKIVAVAQKYTINYKSFYNQFLFDPNQVFEVFKVFPDSFSSFRKKIEKKNVPSRCLCEIPKQQLLNIESLISITLDVQESDFNSHTAFPFKGGEKQAILRLHDYIFKTKKIGSYKKTRNGLLGKDYSSKFSPWLALGCLSPRQIYWSIKDFESKQFANQSTYWLIFEILWRDFFKFSSIKHPINFFAPGGIQQKTVFWKSDSNQLKKWIDGKTDDDFVNANMLELKNTGWMSNRGRQNVASYFVHHLKMDWRLGAAYFESMLLDYDVHSNYGNWMYVAGVGSHKKVKVFDTKKQAAWFDPSRKYRKLWLQPTLF